MPVFMYRQCNFGQEEQIKSLRESIAFLQKELEPKQRFINNFYEKMTVCLHTLS